MSHSSHETHQYIDNCLFALEHTFTALGLGRRLTGDIERNLENLRAAAERPFDYFLAAERGPAAENALYGLHMKQTENAKAQVKEIEAKGPIPDQVGAELARMGATREATSVLASSVLQLAKQVLSFRFGRKPKNLPGVRMVGGQSVVELIWEGRNHSLHWEEGAPHSGVQQLADALQRHLGCPIDLNVNNAVLIVDLLEWTTAADVTKDLQAIIA